MLLLLLLLPLLLPPQRETLPVSSSPRGASPSLQPALVEPP
jgi:hypothetical protein